MTCGFCRGTFTAPATLFHTGGSIVCPHCQRRNVVGAQVQQPAYYSTPAQPQRPTTAPSKFETVIAVVFGVMLASFVVSAVAPLLGLLLGLLTGGVAAGYLAADKFRGHVDRLLPAFFNSNIRRFGLAAVTLIWGFVLIAAAITGFQQEREEEKAEQTRREVIAAKAEADAEARDALLASAKQKLASGDLDGAQADLTSAKAYPKVPEMTAVSDELAAALRERDLQSLPGLLADVQAHNLAEKWNAALDVCTRARAIDPQYPGLQAACDAASEGQRLASIPEWIDAALAVAGDADNCETPLAISEAWKNLQQIQPSDPGYEKAKKAASKLEKCRKKTERVLSDGVREVMVMQRVNWAEAYETEMLNQGIDMRVKLSGTHKNRVTIRWVLFSRVTVHDLVKDGTYLANLEKIGFEKVTFSDGFYESWSYELSPQSEEGGGKVVLEGMGLGKPLSL